MTLSIVTSKYKKQYQRPEGKLIEAAYKRARISVEEAAKRGGLKDQRFRDIVNGYDFSRGSVSEVVASPERLAQIALGLEITEEQLRATGRADAADELAILRGLDAAEEHGDRPELRKLRQIQSDVEWLIDRLLNNSK